MRVVVQRVSEASVKIDGKIKSSIEKGLLVLVGIEEQDHDEDLAWMVAKVVNQRIFSDSEGKMNLSLKDIDGELLLISQFTLYANTKKGNRPSFTQAARPDIAIPLYQKMIALLTRELGKPIHTGEFGADMKVNLTNDGPVTIVMDSKVRG